MLRFTCSRAINLARTVLKNNSKVYINNKSYLAVIKLSNIPIAFYSESNQNPKSPLGNLIDKNTSGNKDKEQPDDEEAKVARESAWRKMKITLIIFGITFVCIGGYLVFLLGQQPLDEHGEPCIDAYSHLPVWKQYIFRTLSELDYYRRLIKEPSREKLLPDPLKYPYYQPPYTLILELTDILVHPEWTYKTGWRFKKRPAVEQFLESLNGLYEIVIYTAEQGMTVFPIVEALDPKNIIAYKLVRDSTHFVNGHHVKNLDKINRDLSKVVVIDWNRDSVQFHPDNLFCIPRWKGNENDTTLLDLSSFLRTLAHSEVDDVREVLKHFGDFYDPLAAFRERQKKLIDQQEKEAMLHPNPASPFKRWWIPSFLNKPW